MTSHKKITGSIYWKRPPSPGVGGSERLGEGWKGKDEKGEKLKKKEKGKIK